MVNQLVCQNDEVFQKSDIYIRDIAKKSKSRYKNSDHNNRIKKGIFMNAVIENYQRRINKIDVVSKVSLKLL